MDDLPSFAAKEKNLIDNEEFHFRFQTDKEKIHSIHQLQFNDSIKIRMKHYYYDYSFLNKSQSVIIFKFLDAKESEIIRFTIIPGVAEFKLVCANRSANAATFPNNTYRKYYEFVIIFSNIGIMLFYMDEFYIKTTYCINRIPDITKFTHTVTGIHAFEAIVQIPSEEVRMPKNWIIFKPIPIKHKFTLDYFSDVKSIITIQLLDKRGELLLSIIVNDIKGLTGYENSNRQPNKELGKLIANKLNVQPFLLRHQGLYRNYKSVHTRRIGSDIWYLPCIHTYTLKYDEAILGKIEVSVFQTRFQIGLRIITEENKIDMTECRTYMLIPHDIQYITFNSTNPNTIVYAQYVTPA